MSLELDKNHVYTVDGIEFPGVTTIIRSIFPVKFSNQSTMDRGTEVHSVTADYDLDNPVMCDDSILPFLNGWKSFLAAYKPEVIKEYIERKLHSKKWKFAGKLDRIFRINKGLILIDLKSSFIFDKFANPLQTAGYEILAEEELGIKIKERWGVHLSKEGKFKVIEHKSGGDKTVFLSCLNIDRYKRSLQKGG